MYNNSNFKCVQNSVGLNSKNFFAFIKQFSLLFHCTSQRFVLKVRMRAHICFHVLQLGSASASFTVHCHFQFVDGVVGKGFGSRRTKLAAKNFGTNCFLLSVSNRVPRLYKMAQLASNMVLFLLKDTAEEGMFFESFWRLCVKAIMF